MTTNILLTLLASLLTLSGVHTSSMNNENVNTKVSTNVSSESVEQSDESQDYDADENYEDDSMTLEEKYEHNQNKEDYLEDDGENVIWYDVPYCDNHDYEVIDSDTETLYICKKCGYSEFYEKNIEENNDTTNTETDTESDECNNEDSSENETENTSNEE